MKCTVCLLDSQSAREHNASVCKHCVPFIPSTARRSHCSPRPSAPFTGTRTHTESLGSAPRAHQHSPSRLRFTVYKCTLFPERVQVAQRAINNAQRRREWRDRRPAGVGQARRSQTVCCVFSSSWRLKWVNVKIHLLQ